MANFAGNEILFDGKVKSILTKGLTVPFPVFSYHLYYYLQWLPSLWPWSDSTICWSSWWTCPSSKRESSSNSLKKVQLFWLSINVFYSLLVHCHLFEELLKVDSIFCWWHYMDPVMEWIKKTKGLSWSFYWYSGLLNR